MRELKFRVWNNRYNEFVRPDYGLIGFCYPLDGRIAALTTSGEPMEGCIIEQYTGLKDKSGKEIYEGDIVEASIDGAWTTDNNSVSFGKVKWKLEVIYNDIRFMDVFKVIGSKNAPNRIYYLFDKELSELEVIGNIHETPGLLVEIKNVD